jgi:hypothetical protein
MTKDESKNNTIDTEDCSTLIPSACAIGSVAFALFEKVATAL